MQSHLTPLAAALRPLLLGFALAAVTPALLAAEPTAEHSAARAFDIPAGRLDSALGQFGQQAGVMVAVDSQLSQGLRSPGLQGT
ncbi:MAG: TonB-dependent siderophore receptor, partial [Pseudomonas sp.]